MITAISTRPYKQKARARAQQRTRDALLDAADEAFFAGRWQKTSLEALAARAGVTKQTLLRHFTSKEGLLVSSLMRGGTQVLAQRWSAPQGDVEGIVENLLDHYQEWGRRSLRIGAWLEEGNPLLARLSLLARHVHYQWVDYAFARWLEPLSEPQRTRRRDALIALCDVHTWWLLSHDLGLERTAVRATLTEAITAIVGESV